MVNTRELIQKAFDGEIEESVLMEKLKSRSERQIIDDLKALEFESLLNTRDCIEESIETSPELDTEEVRKSLGYLYKAIRERCSELIDAERRVKELLNS